MSVDPFFNDRATIGVFERAFYAGREAAEEVEAILEWRARPRRVLDVGCNAGLHALEWARRGVEVVGIDSAPVAIALARQRAAGIRDYASRLLISPTRTLQGWGSSTW